MLFFSLFQKMEIIAYCFVIVYSLSKTFNELFVSLLSTIILFCILLFSKITQFHHILGSNDRPWVALRSYHFSLDDEIVKRQHRHIRKWKNNMESKNVSHLQCIGQDFWLNTTTFSVVLTVAHQNRLRAPKPTNARVPWIVRNISIRSIFYHPDEKNGSLGASLVLMRFKCHPSISEISNRNSRAAVQTHINDLLKAAVAV